MLRETCRSHEPRLTFFLEMISRVYMDQKELGPSSSGIDYPTADDLHITSSESWRSIAPNLLGPGWLGRDQLDVI